MGIFSTRIFFILNHAGLAFLIFTAISAVKTEDCEVRSVYNSVYSVSIIVNNNIYFKFLKSMNKLTDIQSWYINMYMDWVFR